MTQTFEPTPVWVVTNYAGPIEVHLRKHNALCRAGDLNELAVPGHTTAEAMLVPREVWEAMQWRKASASAPLKDGSLIDVWSKEFGSKRIRWEADALDGPGWYTDEADYYPSSWFSHWMPLPAPPATKEPTDD